MAQGKGVKADGGPRKARKTYHRDIKVDKRRGERRRARQDPECVPLYGKYGNWEA